MQNTDEFDAFEPKNRVDEEEEFYTELATNASQIWIEGILHKRFPFQDDFRKSLEDGIFLCELLNTIAPNTIKKINRLPSKIAGIDNINVFLQQCKDVFKLSESQCFRVADLEDLSQRAITSNQLADEQRKRNRRVLTTIYYLGKAAVGLYEGPSMDFSAFTGIVSACPVPNSSVGNGGAHHGQTDERRNGNGIIDQSNGSLTERASNDISSLDDNVSKQKAPGGQPPSLNGSNIPTTNDNNQAKDTSIGNGRTPQSKTSQPYQYVKSGFSLPTGPSSLTQKAVEQMRLISESRASSSLQAPVAKTSQKKVPVNNAVDDDAWQSDLDMWRMKRKQSLQSTCPPEVLQSVGLLDDDTDGNGSNKKSDKKPGLLSKLRYSDFDDDGDPIVAPVNNSSKKNEALAMSPLQEQLPKETAYERLDEMATNVPSQKSESSNGSDNVLGENGEKNVKDFEATIRQAPGNLRGFGFSVKGGRDTQQALTVDRVTAGSAADDADLQPDDEILKINNDSVATYFRPTINRLIQQGVKTGQITLLLRRHPSPPASNGNGSAGIKKESRSIPKNGNDVAEPFIKPKPVDENGSKSNMAKVSSPVITKLPPQQSTSPSLSTASSTSSSTQQQRYVLGASLGFRGSPSASNNNNNGNSSTVLSSSGNSINDESVGDSPTLGSRSASKSQGHVLIRGGANGNSSAPAASSIPQPWNSPRSKVESKAEKSPINHQPPQQQQLPRSVSSRELCAACHAALGAGPAMAIERLGLFYHVRCFCCSVCKISLSNGHAGVDVRVKGSRLHCQNCNSSDESGLQSSQV